MSDPKKITFEVNITGSVTLPEFPAWFENIVAGFSPELKQDVVNEIIADDLENLFRDHEAKNGVKADEIPHLPVGTKLDVWPHDDNPLAWLEDPDFGANLGRKTATQHAQAARARVAAGRGRPAKTVDPQAVVRTRNAFLAVDDTRPDPFGLGRANSAKLDVIRQGLRADPGEPASLKRLADALGRHADLMAKTGRKVH